MQLKHVIECLFGRIVCLVASLEFSHVAVALEQQEAKQSSSLLSNILQHSSLREEEEERQGEQRRGRREEEGDKRWRISTNTG